MVDGDKKIKKTLEQRKAELQKQLAIVNQKLSQKERKDDTRRKILVGAIILDECEKESQEMEKLLSKLKEKLIRDDDRALFGFSPIKINEEN